ncbi:hypothetical protein PoB_005968800 [Plakobranchus ocellatus]|uniref:Uncharacterized protein n=1 Tax=Plakobranchus ocellatus TaxID=259542 RepID=A0AAV4CMK2_9GAST|nr:hypothetical protein PoB_005968800 [Plakobranchus ocellatus]
MSNLNHINCTLWVFVNGQSTTRRSQAFRPSTRPESQWRGSDLRQKDPSRSQGGLASARRRNIELASSASITVQQE